MENTVIMAGFGGQGMLLIGKILAHAGMHEGKEVSWLPSYGPEMRGGTANCTVVVSDKPVGSPLVYHPRAAIVMNLPSLDKFEPLVRPGGLVVVNTSLIRREPVRTDITVMRIPATEMAADIGGSRVANMIVFGAYVAAAAPVSVEGVRAVMGELFGHKPAVLEANQRAFLRGVEIGTASARVEAA
jgi:2-oxoglutarate ferredoxin oxidoreductase subunit gamma